MRKSKSSKISDFLEKNKEEAILLTLIALISLLSFAMGYIVAKKSQEGELRIGYQNHIFYTKK
jgi:hypothetical protein